MNKKTLDWWNALPEEKRKDIKSIIFTEMAVKSRENQKKLYGAKGFRNYLSRIAKLPRNRKIKPKSGDLTE